MASRRGLAVRRGRAVFWAVLAAACVMVWGCRTRRFESTGIRSTGNAGPYVHWVPKAPGQNRSWEDERSAREARLRMLIEPRFDERAVKALVDGDYKSSVWGFEWQRDTPVGYSGIPLIVFRAILSDAQLPQSPFKNIWRELGWYGLTPHPNDFDANGNFLASSRNKRVLPLGMGWTRSPGTAGENQGEVGEFLSKVGLNPQDEIRSQVAQRAFISCGACHTGRVARTDGSIVFLYGAPSTEYDQTAFGKALADTLVVIKTELEGGLGAQLVDRLNGAIDRLSQEEEFFPYGNSSKEILVQSSWKSPFGFVLRKAATDKIKAKMTDILKAMPAQLDLRNQIVDKLRESAYPDQVSSDVSSKVGKPPHFDGESPGQLDAFGFGGAIVRVFQHQIASSPANLPSSTFRPWDYLNWVTFGDSKPFWVNIKETRGSFQQRVDGYVAALKAHTEGPNQEPVVPRFAAKVDPSAIWGERPTLRSQANWDGNQRSAGARALSTSLAIVASPANVDVEGSSYVAKFMAYDPMAHGTPRGEKALPQYPSASPVYPFPIKEDLLEAGQKIFEGRCYTCHHPQNTRVYPINPALVPSDLLANNLPEQRIEPEDVGWVGTDPYRAIQITTPVRNGLLALWNLTCQMREWCASKLEGDNDVFRKRGDQGQLTGYVAAPLDGIWARAPYLHNGSVPTIRALLVPERRQTEFSCGSGPKVKGFWRGNIQYDQDNLGFVSTEPPFARCDPNWQEKGLKSPFDDIPGQVPRYRTASKSARLFDTTLVGNSNGGHMGAYLGADSKDGVTKWESWKVRDLLPDFPSDGAVGNTLASDALIEYMKTL